MTLSILHNHLPRIKNSGISALFLVFSFSGFSAESDSCAQAKKVYEQNRQELRSGYKIRRGNWLNCIEDKSNDAKRKYCRLKKVKEEKHTSVKAEIEGGCINKGVKRF